VTVHQLILDFKKACDSFRREVLCIILIEFGVPMKLVGLIKMYINDMLSGKFHTQNRLKKGDALSPLLFNLALEYAELKVQVN
jgi:hypothetical protein